MYHGSRKQRESLGGGSGQDPSPKDIPPVMCLQLDVPLSRRFYNLLIVTASLSVDSSIDYDRALTIQLRSK